MANSLWKILQLIVMTSSLSCSALRSSSEEADSNECEPADDFWGSFGNGFVTETVAPGDSNYTRVSMMFSQDPDTALPPKPTATPGPGRRKRGTCTWCDSIYYHIRLQTWLIALEFLKANNWSSRLLSNSYFGVYSYSRVIFD